MFYHDKLDMAMDMSECFCTCDRAGVDGTRADYVKVIERVDWSVGRLLDSLSEHAAIQGDCLTVFTCDHGGAEMGAWQLCN